MGYVQDAIEDHVNGAKNPVPNVEFVKTTISCFVWHRDTQGQLTSCRGPLGKIDMFAFCTMQPDRPNPDTDRDCGDSGEVTNPIRIDVDSWLESEEGRSSNQQLGLETVVGKSYSINLGFYTPDQPLPGPSSGLGCENNCFFLLGNPADNPARVGPIDNESNLDAWTRHEGRHNNQNYGYKSGGTTTYFVHVLLEETGAATWITFALQTQ